MFNGTNDGFSNGGNHDSHGNHKDNFDSELRSDNMVNKGTEIGVFISHEIAY
jgi:hypothetical protein